MSGGDKSTAHARISGGGKAERRKKLEPGKKREDFICNRQTLSP